MIVVWALPFMVLISAFHRVCISSFVPMPFIAEMKSAMRRRKVGLRPAVLNSARSIFSTIDVATPFFG
ncbi:hypothetical protein D3C86_1537200 [compost metagenome]